MIQTHKDLIFLFSECTFNQLETAQLDRMKRRMESIGQDQLLGTSLDDWCDFFESEYHIDPISLILDSIEVESKEVDVDVRNDWQRDIIDKSKPYFLKGLEVSYIVPYKGDIGLFKVRPTVRSFNPPRGQIKNQNVVLIYSFVDHGSDALQRQAQTDIDNLKSYVQNLANDVEDFNSHLREKAHEFLTYRREKVMKDKQLVESLGFPLRRRDGASLTYTVPQTKKRLNRAMPEAPKTPFAPEPTLKDEDYEEILQIISRMALVLEQSPQAFKNMQEEDLRTHFLVQLNGQYQGSATGETFNYEGKTDILIREKGQNIFIAECKFWAGPKSLSDTIDQLLRYVTWRDTKTAIIIFNRYKDFSNVLTKIPEVVSNHPNYKRELKGTSELSFRYTMRHRDDANREFFLTILAFEVPV